MAVLLLSLHSLQRNRPAATEISPSDGRDFAPAVVPAVQTHAVAALPQPPIAAPLAAARLGFSQSEVEALVQQAGPDAGRLLLSLLCRISSVESELAELRQQIGRAPAYAPAPGPQLRQASQSDPSSKGRSALLEKVFQNNQILWKLIEGDL